MLMRERCEQKYSTQSAQSALVTIVVVELVYGSSGQPDQFRPFVFVRTDRRLLSGAVHVLDTVVPCENSQSGVRWVAVHYGFRNY